jgi:hypothetical protein
MSAGDLASRVTGRAADPPQCCRRGLSVPGGVPAAKKAAARKKALPLPCGSVRAAYAGTCPACSKDYGRGEVITKTTDGWGHPGCAPRRLSAAELEFARNKARIDSGEAFRSRKPSDWRLGASPSNARPAR